MTSPHEIYRHLEDISDKNSVEVLFAVETGSRVWRMESKDSDYDIRFVYMRDIGDYLRISPLPTVIQKMEDNLDFVGFDIFKFTKLLLSSNPSLIEWLKSDIKYYTNGDTKEVFKEFITKKYNPISLHYHYKSMCKQNYLKYLKSGDCMSYKKYLYAMRGLINSLWVTQFKTLPPIDFNDAIKNINDVPVHILKKLNAIIKSKKKGEEKDKVARIPNFDNYIESFLKKEYTVENRKILDYSEIQSHINGIILPGEFD